MDMSLSKLRSWWLTGKPSMLQSKGLQRIRHDWVTELNWTKEDTGRRQPSTCPGDRPQEEPNLLAPWSWTSCLQDCETINFCLCKLPGLWSFAMAARADESRDLSRLLKEKNHIKNSFTWTSWVRSKERTLDKQGLRKQVINTSFLRQWLEEMVQSNENWIRKKSGVSSSFCLQFIELHLSGWWWNECEL